MNDFIKDIAMSETKSVFKKALVNFAKKNDVTCPENQLLIRQTKMVRPTTLIVLPLMKKSVSHSKKFLE